MASALSFWSRVTNIGGRTFGGKRNLYKTLGYLRELQPDDFLSRYKRNAIAHRIVESAPKATWRGGVAVVEDAETQEPATAFELGFDALATRLNLYDKLYRVDKLSRIYRYGVLVVGGPGDPSAPLETLSGPDDLKYLQPYGERDAKIVEYDTDRLSARFGYPTFYNIARTTFSGNPIANAVGEARRFHWTRVLHVAEGLLDDNLFGEPACECVWNDLDDLEKIKGAGAEAFWRRADRGMQYDIDPTQDLDEAALKALKEQVESYEHEMKRYLTTRGVKINQLGSDVASIAAEVSSIISIISAGTGIPQRVLMGSEQGKLAAKQDRASWDNAITDRQNDYAGPCLLRPLVDKLVTLGAVPEPAQGPSKYEVVWSSIRTMDDEQRAGIAREWAGLNVRGGTIVVLPDEIRERVLGLPPMAEVDPSIDAYNASILAEPYGTVSSTGLADAPARGVDEPVVAIGNGNNQYKKGNATQARISRAQAKRSADSFIKLHNAASKEFSAAFKEEGVRMWQDDDAHPIPKENAEFVAQNIQNGSKLEIARPLDRLDNFHKDYGGPHSEKKLQEIRDRLKPKIDAIREKYQGLWNQVLKKRNLEAPTIAAGSGVGQPYEHIHRAADTFRAAGRARRLGLLRGRPHLGDGRRAAVGARSRG